MAKNILRANGASAQIPVKQRPRSCPLWKRCWEDHGMNTKSWKGGTGGGCTGNLRDVWSSHGPGSSTPGTSCCCPPAHSISQPFLCPANLLQVQQYFLGSQRAFLSHRHIKKIKPMND